MYLPGLIGASINSHPIVIGNHLDCRVEQLSSEFICRIGQDGHQDGRVPQDQIGYECLVRLLFGGVGQRGRRAVAAGVSVFLVIGEEAEGEEIAVVIAGSIEARLS